MPNIGQRRERVRIVRTAKTRRTDGGYDTVGTTLCEFWASVKPVSANEAEQAGRKASATTYIIEAVRNETFTTEDSLVWLTAGELVMNIREIRLPSKRTSLMTIVAESGVTL